MRLYFSISIYEALKDPNWGEAFEEKFNFLIDMKTLISVNKPKNIKPFHLSLGFM